MKSKTNKALLLGLVAVLVMALGAVAVFAQDDATPYATTDTQSRPALPFGRGFDSFRDRADHGSANDEALADALGITVEELQAARQKVAADRLAQAVEDGIITQDEANTLLAMQALKGYLDRTAIMAQALGVSVEEFEAAHDEGTLSDLMANITPAELSERMQAATEAAVNQAVADNVITQTQADLVLERIQNGGHSLGGGFDGHHGHGGRRGGIPGGFYGAPQNSESGETVTPFGNFNFQGAPNSGA